MAAAKYSKRRRLIQGLSLAILASIPLRLLCLDIDGECLRVYGKEFGFETMFYPLFSIIALLLFVIIKSMSKGRIFCSHMCPMHLFLEIVNAPKNRNATNRPVLVWLWGLLLSFFLTEIFISFFQPINEQIRIMASGSILMIGTFSASMISFMCLFVLYQEKFCKRACPYALMQMLLQSDKTRIMQFANPDKTCTNCRKCDEICPENLRPRFESKSADCTNCNLCSEACTGELGEGNTLFNLIDPEPKPNA